MPLGNVDRRIALIDPKDAFVGHEQPRRKRRADCSCVADRHDSLGVVTLNEGLDRLDHAPPELAERFAAWKANARRLLEQAALHLPRKLVEAEAFCLAEVDLAEVVDDDRLET